MIDLEACMQMFTDKFVVVFVRVRRNGAIKKFDVIGVFLTKKKAFSLAGKYLSRGIDVALIPVFPPDIQEDLLTPSENAQIFNMFYKRG